MPKPKFIITNQARSSIQTWYGANFTFMEGSFLLEAQIAGYELSCLLFRTISKDAEGRVTAKIFRIKFNNEALLKRIIDDDEAIKKFTDISNNRLKKSPLEGFNKHDDKNLPLSFIRIYWMAKEDMGALNLLQEICNRDPKIELDLTKPFVEQEKMDNVVLQEFMKGPDDVLYLRFALNDEKLNLLKLVQEQCKVKCPVNPQSIEFNAKLVVVENEVLQRYSLPLTTIAYDDKEVLAKLKEFYKTHGSTEGLVMKPYRGGQGNGIFFLNPGLSENAVDETLRNWLNSISSFISSNNPEAKYYYDQIIVQQRLTNLTKDDSNSALLAGDIRFSIINGELFGTALRYSDKEEVLSYAKTRSLLQGKTFNEANVRELIASCADEGLRQYYTTLLEMHKSITEVTTWCRENGHFHVGADVLLGRDSKGQWKFCLTELNNIQPDCIPETVRINRQNGEEKKKIDICKTIVSLIKEGEYIRSPSLDMHPSDKKQMVAHTIDKTT